MKFKLLLVLLFFVSPLLGQEDISDDVKQAMEEITEADVLSAVSFLASDEMAGRDTPSQGLTIASSYIASRFRGAGLKGGAAEESFYQKHEIATVQVPTEGVVLERNGESVKHFGLLAAGPETLTHEGEVVFVDHSEDWRDKKFTGPVCFTPKPFESPRDQFAVMQQLNSLRRNGATAVLVQVDSDNPLVGLAQQATAPTMVNPRFGFPPMTMLVPKMEAGGQFKVVIPPQKSGKAEVVNVIGVLPGSDPELSKEAIIFSAHLDHIGSNMSSGDNVFNGADDNATGCTAICELADAYGALENRPKRTLIFMTFWGEEKGLLGSRHYARNPEWPLDKTICNINLEMVGRPEPGANEKAWMSGWHQSDLGELMAASSKRIGVLIFEHPEFSEMLYRASDNASFVDQGVIGHSFSAGSLHDDYHQLGDHWEKLEVRHMTKVIQGLFVGALPIANGEVTPQKAK